LFLIYRPRPSRVDDDYGLLTSLSCRTNYEKDPALFRMANEIGFRDHDVEDIIRPYERIHTIALGLGEEEEERVIRPRSSNDESGVVLLTNMSSVVFVDRRSRDQLQVCVFFFLCVMCVVVQVVVVDICNASFWSPRSDRCVGGFFFLFPHRSPFFFSLFSLFDSFSSFSVLL